MYESLTFELKPLTIDSFYRHILISYENAVPFIEKLNELILAKGIYPETYNIEAFASDMCMSRATLYRKIIALTAQKPTEFIRTIRLKHAARLIHEGNHSLTEIGYMCGFNSPSYFYRCFKAQYGVQPGNY